ncbi:hypothetical protein J6590_034018 [Homalodisca vitripennis]|nr:hypothetical protein J6590_034018 [Homalodisca vitripennis]
MPTAAPPATELRQRATRVSALQQHRQIHGGKLFKCEEPGCVYAGRSWGDLRLHLRSHGEERPFHCSDCDFSTKTKAQLLRVAVWCGTVRCAVVYGGIRASRVLGHELVTARYTGDSTFNYRLNHGFIWSASAIFPDTEYLAVVPQGEDLIDARHTFLSGKLTDYDTYEDPVKHGLLSLYTAPVGGRHQAEAPRRPCSTTPIDILVSAVPPRYPTPAHGSIAAGVTPDTICLAYVTVRDHNTAPNYKRYRERDSRAYGRPDRHHGPDTAGMQFSLRPLNALSLRPARRVMMPHQTVYHFVEIAGNIMPTSCYISTIPSPCLMDREASLFLAGLEVTRLMFSVSVLDGYVKLTERSWHIIEMYSTALFIYQFSGLIREVISVASGYKAIYQFSGLIREVI